MAVHELGHVAGAWMTGARVTMVVLHPLAISRTDVVDNQRPLVVVWAGPIVGVVAPLAVWLVAERLGWPEAYLVRFFAGFCLIANGAYIGVGSFEGIGDAGVMLQHGSSRGQLWMFGLVCVPLGLWLWHGLGSRFGLGAAEGQVNSRTAYACLVMAAIVLVTCSWLGE